MPNSLSSISLSPYPATALLASQLHLFWAMVKAKLPVATQVAYLVSQGPCQAVKSQIPYGFKSTNSPLSSFIFCFSGSTFSCSVPVVHGPCQPGLPAGYNPSRRFSMFPLQSCCELTLVIWKMVRKGSTGRSWGGHAFP